jgi:hypothetical protein
MAVFVELTTDSFTDTFNAASRAKQQRRRAGSDSVRRPLRGLEIKDDTYAILKVVQSDGQPIAMVDSGTKSGTNTQYANFILQSVQEARMEKHQIVETFGEPYIYFFGESPRFLDVTAVLVDSNDFNWYAEWWQNYNMYLRGTRSVELGARTYLFYDDNIVEGYMLSAQARKTSDTPLMVMLQFRLYLTNYSNVTIVGDAADPRYPTYVNMPADATLTTSDQFQVGPPTEPENYVDIYESGLNSAYLGAYQQGGIGVSAGVALGASLGAGAGIGVGAVAGVGAGAGFGGGASLSAALRAGVRYTGTPYVDQYLSDASSAQGTQDNNFRTLPTRGLIQDNQDEWTGASPTPVDLPTNDPAQTYYDEEYDPSYPDAYDLPYALTSSARRYGVSPYGYNDYGNLGLLPTFSTSTGFGIGIGGGSYASFGAYSGSGFGSEYNGGINGGLGFTGGFTSYTSASLIIQPPNVAAGLYAANLSSNAAYNEGVYGNGVPIYGGVSQGTGIGGGIPYGIGGGIGPNGPGTLNQFSGGQSYATGNGFLSGNGYGYGMSAVGASVSVGGSPSLFSSWIANGTLTTESSTEIDFFIGPDGNQSDVNTTGMFI